MPVPGTGVTTTLSVRESTTHRSADEPVPSRSFMAIPAPTDEIHDWILL